MVISRLPTSFQFSRTACAGVGGVFGCAPSCARAVPAWLRSSAGVARRKIKRASLFMSDLLLGLPRRAPQSCRLGYRASAIKSSTIQVTRITEPCIWRGACPPVRWWPDRGVGFPTVMGKEDKLKAPAVNPQNALEPLEKDIGLIVRGEHSDPFAVLGPHWTEQDG